eukprot:scaffold9391_cov39-Cyclotella_meneghiniana.AAC.8
MDRSKGFSRGREGTVDLYYSISDSIAGGDVMVSIVKYFKAEFPFESYGENVVFDSLTFFEAGHGHKSHRGAAVQNAWENLAYLEWSDVLIFKHFLSHLDCRMFLDSFT